MDKNKMDNYINIWTITLIYLHPFATLEVDLNPKQAGLFRI